MTRRRGPRGCQRRARGATIANLLLASVTPSTLAEKLLAPPTGSGPPPVDGPLTEPATETNTAVSNGETRVTSTAPLAEKYDGGAQNEHSPPEPAAEAERLEAPRFQVTPGIEVTPALSGPTGTV